ncbi:hypothetical protein SKAU_G00391550 [Synaphobranchus kaupii]|uniref:Uncharacterized protein n=1 Tax=Synaphobranchus kaupii TaxID=118154 RepID=A0A9Q1EBJ6_SYNKA|nr:hypothetical protein SKAU_G00391550 [Synaphobranchus kaupii]
MKQRKMATVFEGRRLTCGYAVRAHGSGAWAETGHPSETHEEKNPSQHDLVPLRRPFSIIGGAGAGIRLSDRLKGDEGNQSVETSRRMGSERHRSAESCHALVKTFRRFAPQ